MVRWTEDEYNAYQKRHHAELARQQNAKAAPPEPEPAMTVQPTTDEARLNKTERAYLARLRGLGCYPWVGVQCITLKLGDDCRYTPDFWVLDPDGNLGAREVKGFFRDDAKVKIKVAARLYPWIKFVVVKKDKLGWNESEVKP